jgi:hypothetical protein
VLCSIEHHLQKVKRKAIVAGYQDNTMIVSGVEHILKMCIYNHDSVSEDHIQFTIRLILYILPRRSTFYELITGITNNFVEHRDVGYALVDMLVLLSRYRDKLRLQHPQVIDNNFKRIFTEPKAIYQGEFNSYIYPSNYDSDDTDSEDEIEDFNEYYQILAPSKEEQLDRLEREIKMKLCEDCLMPYKDQACDCWLQEIGEDIFSK